MTRKILFIAVAVLFLAVLITLIARIDLQECDALRNPVDAVVVLAGRPDEDRQRLTRGVHLVEQGHGRYLILPSGTAASAGKPCRSYTMSAETYPERGC